SGGGLFVWASARFSWQVLLASMGVLIVGVMAVAAAAPATRTRAHAPQPLARVVGDLGRALRAPGSGVLLPYLATYTRGEAMAGTMWTPLLVDSRFDKPFIGLATGVVGMAASIAGSLGGGWLATRLPLVTALVIPATVRVLPLAAQAVVALAPTRAGV